MDSNSYEAAIRDISAMVRKRVDDLAHQPREEFDDHQRFEEGRQHEAHLILTAISELGESRRNG